MPVYAIGDVQGCYDSLRHLLDRFDFDPAHDRLWFVGDLVNRGPRSLEVLRFVRSLGSAAVTVLGNHDLYLLMLAEGAEKRRGQDDTLEAVLTAPDRGELLHWLRCQPLFHSEGEWAMVHAGLLPGWSIRKAGQLAREVEKVLSGPGFSRLMRKMWGSEPTAWSEDLEGWDRLRVIVNAMTRMRFCSPGGEMEFKTKGEVASAPAGFLPWFDVPGRKSAGERLLVGHWSALGLLMRDDLIALDTGCLWGRELTAVRLEDRAVFQVASAEVKN